MFCRISNALNSYFGVTKKELNVYIRPYDNFVLIGNQPFSLWVITTTLACWLIHSQFHFSDKSRLLQAHLEWLHFVSLHFTEVLVTYLHFFFGISLSPQWIYSCKSHFVLSLITNGNVVTDFPFLNLTYICYTWPFWSRVGSCI